MTDAEKVLRATIREYAGKNNAKVINIWREKRKGEQYISGRQLKLRVLSCNAENVKKMGQEIGDWYGFEVKFSLVSRFSCAPCDAYLSFTQTKNSLRIE